jgi:hypothetical protein
MISDLALYGNRASGAFPALFAGSRSACLGVDMSDTGRRSGALSGQRQAVGISAPVAGRIPYPTRCSLRKRSADATAGAAPLPVTALGGRLAALAETAKAYARAAQSDNPQRAYAADWHPFASWLHLQGLSETPPDPEAVGLYLASQVERRGAELGRHPRAAPVRHRLALSAAR